MPDYRSPGSPWKIHAPIGFADYLADPALRREAWRRKFAMDDIYAGARPGRGHRALTRLYSEGRLGAVVTQNIDGLQQATGMPQDAVIELHGNGTYAACLDCGTRFELAPIRRTFEADDILPRCPCGGIVKSASIAFGQPIPQDIIRRAASAVLSCDLLLVLGSSLLVRPASRFPELAARNGARIIIVNREPTPLDGVADVVIEDDIGATLDAL